MSEVDEDVERRTEFRIPVAGVMTLTNATSMAYTVTTPGGVTSSPTVANPSTGVYTAVVPKTTVAAEGDYPEKWTAVYGGITYITPDQFTAVTPGPRLLSLAQGKEHLNISSTTNDEELRSLIDAITAVVELEVGPVVPKSYSETVSLSGGVGVLSYAPVLSLTTVVAAQTSYSAPALGDLTLEAATGLVYYTAGGLLPTGRAIFTYRAGRQPIPAAIRMAAKIILAHLWETQHNAGSGRPQFGVEDVGLPPGFAFAVPNRAKELLAPYMLAPAVA